MRITLVAATALMAVMASPALAESKQDFDLVNRTGYTIDKVFVSPSNSKDWDDDVLGRDVLRFLASFGDQAARMNRRLRRSKLARPNI